MKNNTAGGNPTGEREVDMLQPLIRIADDSCTTMRNMIKGIIEYLESKNYNFVPVRLFEINSGHFEEYKTLSDLKKRYMVENNCKVLLYTFREGFVYDDGAEASTDILSVTYEILEDY